MEQLFFLIYEEDNCLTEEESEIYFNIDLYKNNNCVDTCYFFGNRFSEIVRDLTIRCSEHKYDLNALARMERLLREEMLTILEMLD